MTPEGLNNPRIGQFMFPGGMEAHQLMPPLQSGNVFRPPPPLDNNHTCRQTELLACWVRMKERSRSASRTMNGVPGTENEDPGAFKALPQCLGVCGPLPKME